MSDSLWNICMRILAAVVLLVGVYFVASWLVIVMATILAFIFPRYFELIIIGAIIDIVYGVGTHALFIGWYTVGAALLFLIVTFLRTKLSWYE